MKIPRPLTLLTGAVILVGFSLPPQALPEPRPTITLSRAADMRLHPFSDPMLHVYALAVFTLVCGWETRRAWRKAGDRLALLRNAGVALLFAVGVELWQMVLPWRAFEWNDLVWSGVGVFVATFLLAAAKEDLERRDIAEERAERMGGR